MISHSRPWIETTDLKAVENSLASETIAKGKIVKQFESSLVNFVGENQKAISCNNGTSALQLALLSLGLELGDEVVLPTYVCSSVMQAVYAVGAKPVLCDIGENWNLTVESVRQAITPKTKVIIIVHIFGITANVSDFKQFKIPIVEDCCQAFGALDHGKNVGTLGDIAVFSFHATKCFTTGEGGAVLTDSEEYFSKLIEIQEQGQVVSKLSDMQASLGLSQLERYSKFLERRLQMAERYCRELPEDIVLSMRALLGQGNIFFRFLVSVSKVDDRDIDFFSEKGIAVRRGVDTLLHRLNGELDNKYPNAVAKYQTTLSLPIYPALSDDEQSVIIREMNAYFENML